MTRTARPPVTPVILSTPVPGYDQLQVGTLDGKPLRYVAGQPYVGDASVTHAAVGRALLAGVEAALGPVFGRRWPTALAVVAARTDGSIRRDRIMAQGLPPSVLGLVARIADAARRSTKSRAFGDLLLATARIQEAMGGPKASGPGGSTTDLVESLVETTVAVSDDLVRDGTR